jgi:hypothetical protein
VTDTVEVPNPPSPRSRTRPTFAGIAGVLAVLMFVLGALGFWTKSAVLDTDRFESYVTDVLRQPEVTEAIATYVVDQTEQVVQLEARIEEALPPRVVNLLGDELDWIIAGVRSLYTQAVTGIVESEQFQGIVVQAAGTAHAGFVRLLEGDGLLDGINVDEDRITLNLLPLVSRALLAVQDRFGLLADVEVPELTRDGDPAEQQAQLEDALGRDLPDDFAQLTVYEGEQVAQASESVQQAQQIFAFITRALWVLVGLGLVLGAVAIVLARRRVRAALTMILGAGVLMLVTRIVVGIVAGDVTAEVSAPAGRTTADIITTRMLRSLSVVTFSFVVAAALVSVGAYVTRRVLARRA